MAAPTVTYPHLSTLNDGSVRIGRTRYKVSQLAAEHYHHGWTAEEILRQHPDLRPEEVYAALAYFYDHHDAIVGELKASLATTEKQRSQQVSREELLSRKPHSAS